MDKKTLTDLKGSIEKWERIAEGTGEDLKSDNCPLCLTFFMKNFNCLGCPVCEKTGEMACNDSPYDVWRFLADHYSTRKAINPVMVAAAWEMVAFLKELLPPPIDVLDFAQHPFKYIRVVDHNMIEMDDEFIRYFDIPISLFPYSCIETLSQLFELLMTKVKELEGKV